MRFGNLPQTPQILSIRHSDDECRTFYGDKPSRRIFYNVEYDDNEKKHIELLNQAIINDKTIQLPQLWNDQEALRFVYSGGFNIAKAMENLKKHISWLKTPFYHELTLQAQQMLMEGMAYQFGKDNQQRPVLYFIIPKIHAHLNELENVIQAICYLLTQVQMTMFYPYHVENWVIIMDVQNMGVLNLPLKAIGKILDVTQVNYSCMMSSLYIINPSFVLRASWNVVKSMLQPGTDKKIKFITSKELHCLQERINADQIEQKYGGTAPDCVNYWPIQSMLERQQSKATSRMEVHDEQQKSQYHSLNQNTLRFYQSGEQDFLSLSPHYINESNRRSYVMLESAKRNNEEEQKCQMCCFQDGKQCSLM